MKAPLKFQAGQFVVVWQKVKWSDDYYQIVNAKRNKTGEFITFDQPSDDPDVHQTWYPIARFRAYDPNFKPTAQELYITQLTFENEDLTAKVLDQRYEIGRLKTRLEEAEASYVPLGDGWTEFKAEKAEK
jgi:hypothetical protein